jgi:hypothetical protein
VEVTAQVENVQAAHVVQLRHQVILLDGVLNIIGTKPVVNVLSHTKVEEMDTLCFTILTVLSMLDSGKSIKATGQPVVEELPHVISNQT